jgi:hypothetical protein
VVGDSVAVLPTQTEAGAVTAGAAFTVTEEVVLLHNVVPSVNVNVTLPAATPVITPAFVTVATAVFELVQVPPVVGDNVAVLPTQTDAGDVTAGAATTDTDEVVLLQPVVVFVNVNVTLPADTPVITPAFVTVATAVLELVQVPPVVGDNVAVLPSQTEAGAVTTGAALTVTDEVVLLQPVVVFVYVNVTLPAATPVITPAFVTVAKAVFELVHVPPVVGDNVAVLPTHTEAGAVTAGTALTVTDEVVLLHPVAVFVNVNVTLPADTPVMTPAFVTVATAVFELAHVPPVVGDNVAVLPTQTEAGAVTAGAATTVTEEVVLLHPVVVFVNVNVALPADTPVIIPAFVTVATAVFELVHVPPVVGDKVPVLPTHIELGAVTTGGEGTAFIVRGADSAELQKLVKSVT